jgi:hypothetical protein
MQALLAASTNPFRIGEIDLGHKEDQGQQGKTDPQTIENEYARLQAVAGAKPPAEQAAWQAYAARYDALRQERAIGGDEQGRAALVEANAQALKLTQPPSPEVLEALSRAGATERRKGQPQKRGQGTFDTY